MMNNERAFFFGVATDVVDRKGPEQLKCGLNDVVYYYAPGERQGNLADVLGYYRDENERIVVVVKIIATGETVETYQNNIRQ